MQPVTDELRVASALYRINHSENCVFRIAKSFLKFQGIVKLNCRHFLFFAIFWFDTYFSKYQCVSILQKASEFFMHLLYSLILYIRLLSVQFLGYLDLSFSSPTLQLFINIKYLYWTNTQSFPYTGRMFLSNALLLYTIDCDYIKYVLLFVLSNEASFINSEKK